MEIIQTLVLTKLSPHVPQYDKSFKEFSFGHFIQWKREKSFALALSFNSAVWAEVAGKDGMQYNLCKL